ncbi:BglG family transcription antiterminator [Fictibacillus solisalsi]|nr:BglG family transcription antiterminator [Fictibacillus solisalsi]
MNERQNQLLVFLVSRGKSVSVDEIASELNCSEKTVRNDCKVVADHVKSFNLRLIRRRGVGVYLEGPDSAIQALKDEVTHYSPAATETADNIRRLSIIRQLLLRNKETTLQELAENFYISKTLVRNDINSMEEWLHAFNLKLVRKPKVGVKAEGSEKDKRSALSRLTGMLIHAAEEEKNSVNRIFAQYEIAFVKHGLKQLEQKLHYAFTDQALDNLIMHVLISVKRVKAGSKITVSHDEETRIKRTKEFPAVEVFLQDIEKALSVKLPEAEKIYITIRVLGTKIFYHTNHQEEEGKGLARFDVEVLGFSSLLIQEVSEITEMDFSSDRHLLPGLAGHLQTTFHRMSYSLPLSNPMAEDIKKMYRTMFEMIYYALPVVEQKMKTSLPEEEIAYLTLHFQASLERLKKKSARNLRVLVVCSMGIGMSQLIVTKLERKFHSIEIAGTAPASDALREIKEKKPDLVISTVPFSCKEASVIVVSPLMTEEEENEIEHFLQNERGLQKKSSYPILKKLLQEELISIHPDLSKEADIIKNMVKLAEAKGFVKPGYKDSALIRENQSSTAIGGGIAIPHGSPDHVFESVIGMTLFQQPILWGKEQVQIVLLLAVDRENRNLLKELFKEISDMTENPSFIQKLAMQTSGKHVYSLL